MGESEVLWRTCWGTHWELEQYIVATHWEPGKNEKNDPFPPPPYPAPKT
jgi:hypothetical protein